MSVEHAADPMLTVDEHWDQLVTVALLGTDRRDPPEGVGALADLVADTARTSPSERMLAQVAACVAVRRAGVLPGPVLAPLVPPPADERPVCPDAAIARWRHITVSWPVLEDEWTLTLVANGWRVAPELVPDLLRRHRRDAVRRTRACVAAGPLAGWLVDHLPELAPKQPVATVSPEALGELPELPIPPDLAPLVVSAGADTGRVLADGVESGAFAAAHRAVLINLVARIRPDALAAVADVLGAVDPRSMGHGLAAVLADLATTRARMLTELTPP